MVFFNLLFMICIFPICFGFFTVEPLQAVVIMFMGKVVKVVKKPGLSWYFPIGRMSKTVSLGKIKKGSTLWN
jgi:regulator of protease activity HflC (stomatin/prohibitin superfamily)